MTDQLTRIEGLLNSPVAVPPEDLTWTTRNESPGLAFLSIRLQGLSGEDVAALEGGLVSGKQYRLQFHPNEIIDGATIESLLYVQPPEVAHGMIIHKEIGILFQYETKNHNR